MKVDLSEALAAVGAVRGGVANVFLAMSANPGCIASVSAIGAFLREDGVLDQKLREAAILATAGEIRCAYEWTHHWKVVDALGAAEEVHEALHDDGGTSTCQLVVRFVRGVIAERPDRDLRDRVRTELGDAAFTELVVVIGYYRLLAQIVDAFEVELEPGSELRSFD